MLPRRAEGRSGKGSRVRGTLAGIRAWRPRSRRPGPQWVLTPRLGALWSRLRAAERPGLVLRPARVAKMTLAMVLVSFALAAAAFATVTLYGQYGAPRTGASTVAWAVRPATYAVSNCRQCHGTEAEARDTAAHASLLCETCHVPSVAHPGPLAGVVQALPAPTSALCATCHAGAAGRPVSFPQVGLDAHYPGADCLRCHDPHTTAAAAPPEVPHPLVDLPPCVTCHAPGGLKRYPAGHRPAEDGVCLTCHLPGVVPS